MAGKITSGRICVVGERELVIGFRLIGLSDSYIATGEEGAKKVMELLRDSSYSLIMVSESIKEFMDPRQRRMADSSSDPVVVFIPLPGGQDLESVADLARRVLGVEIRG